MALIIEDGTVVTDANSYVTTTYLETYCTARGITLTADSEELLIKAMDYIESLQFIGIKSTSDQPLQWPRYDVVIDGYSLLVTTIPNQLLKGQCEVAIAIDQGNGPLATVNRSKKRVKAGAVEVEYADNASSTNTVRTISASLYKLLGGTSGSNNIPVYRA